MVRAYFVARPVEAGEGPARWRWFLVVNDASHSVSVAESYATWPTERDCNREIKSIQTKILAGMASGAGAR